MHDVQRRAASQRYMGAEQKITKCDKKAMKRMSGEKTASIGGTVITNAGGMTMVRSDQRFCPAPRFTSTLLISAFGV